MDSKSLVTTWFDKWETGDFLNLAITENFKHTSPYGTIHGKEEYIKLVEANKNKFLGHCFELHDEIYEKDRAYVRYTATQGDFTLEVSDWYSPEDVLIEEIVAYYNLDGEISDERKLSTLND